MGDPPEGFPDPWPEKGWTNQQWADFLLHIVLPPEGSGVADFSYSEKQAFLTRALDIACMHSTRPRDRLMDDLIKKLGEAAGMIDSVSMQGSAGIQFVAECNLLIDKARKM